MEIVTKPKDPVISRYARVARKTGPKNKLTVLGTVLQTSAVFFGVVGSKTKRQPGVLVLDDGASKASWHSLTSVSLVI